MPSLQSQWQQVLNAGSDPNSHASIGTRFGLFFDPLHYLTEPFGFQDNYDAFVNKSGDFLNKQGSSVVQPIDKVHRQYDPLHKWITSTPQGDTAANWITNKPASAAGLVYGGITGAEALYGGAGGTGAGGGSGGAGGGGSAAGNSGNLAAQFQNTAFGSSADQLAAEHGIAGGAGIGSATAAGASPTLGQYAKAAMSVAQMAQPQGSGGGGGVMMGNSMLPMSQPVSPGKQPTSNYDQSMYRARGFGRRAIPYRGQIVWV